MLQEIYLHCSFSCNLCLCTDHVMFALEDELNFNGGRQLGCHLKPHLPIYRLHHPLTCMRVVSIAISFTRSVRSYTTMSASPPSSRIQPKWHKPKDISNERPVLKLYNSLTKSKVTFSFSLQRHDDQPIKLL